jgi:hypothetical protein
MQIDEYILLTRRKSGRQTEQSVLSLWMVSLFQIYYAKSEG